MSLVNDMLKDLDRRQAPDNVPPAQAAGYGALTDRSRTGRYRVLLGRLLVVLLLFAAVAGYFAWQLWQNKQTPRLTPSEMAVAPENEMVNAVDKPALPEAASAVVAQPESTKDSVLLVPDQPQVVESHQPVEAQAVAPEVVQHSLPEDVNEVTPPDKIPHVAQPEVVDGNEVTQPAGHADSTVSSVSPAKQPQQKTVPVMKLPVRSPEQLDIESAEYGLSMFQQDRLREALMSLMTFVQSHSINVRSRYALAHIYFQQNMLDEADAQISRDDMKQPSMRELKARIMLARGDRLGAIRVLSYQEPELSGYEGYHGLLAALYQQSGQQKNAVAKYTELIRVKPEHAKWWIGLAISLEQLGQRQSALKAYRKAMHGRDLNSQLAQYGKQRIQALVDSGLQ